MTIQITKSADVADGADGADGTHGGDGGDGACDGDGGSRGDRGDDGGGEGGGGGDVICFHTVAAAAAVRDSQSWFHQVINMELVFGDGKTGFQ